MWDPVSIFAICWALNAGLPEARLSVKEVIETKETIVIVECINKDVTLRSGF